MLYKPEKLKYNLHHNITTPNTFKKRANLKVNSFALIATENGVLTANQIAAAILSIKRKIKQDIDFKVRVFPHIPVTKRPPEMPLGKGKSNIAY